MVAVSTRCCTSVPLLALPSVVAPTFAAQPLMALPKAAIPATLRVTALALCLWQAMPTALRYRHPVAVVCSCAIVAPLLYWCRAGLLGTRFALALAGQLPVMHVPCQLGKTQYLVVAQWHATKCRLYTRAQCNVPCCTMLRATGQTQYMVVAMLGKPQGTAPPTHRWLFMGVAYCTAGQLGSVLCKRRAGHGICRW